MVGDHLGLQAVPDQDGTKHPQRKVGPIERQRLVWNDLAERIGHGLQNALERIVRDKQLGDVTEEAIGEPLVGASFDSAAPGVHHMIGYRTKRSNVGSSRPCARRTPTHPLLALLRRTGFRPGGSRSDGTVVPITSAELTRNQEATGTKVR